MNTHRLAIPLLAMAQAQKEMTHNEALALIDASLFPAVEDWNAVVPPSAPTAGQCWLLGATTQGAWTGKGGRLACWTVSGWRYLDLPDGAHCWVKAADAWACLRNSVWSVGEVRGTGLFVEGQKVVSGRQPGIAKPTAGGVIDTEARSAISALIDTLGRHGLIAIPLA